MVDGQRDGQEEIRVVQWEDAWRAASILPTPESASESAPLVFSCGLSRVRLVRPTLCLRRDALVACLMPARFASSPG